MEQNKKPDNVREMLSRVAPIVPPFGPTGGGIPLRPSTVPILQTLINETDGWQKNVETANKRLEQSRVSVQEYVDQCAVLLGLDPKSAAFDMGKAVFVPRQTGEEAINKVKDMDEGAGGGTPD